MKISLLRIAITTGLVLIPLAVFAQGNTATSTHGGQTVSKRLNIIPPGAPPPSSVHSPATSTKSAPDGIEIKNRSGSTTKALPEEIELHLLKRDELRKDLITLSSTTPQEKEEITHKIAEKRAEMLKRMTQQLVGRVKAAIDRLSKLSDRIDSRINKQKEKGIDTSSAEANIAIARTKLALARTAVEIAENSIKDRVQGTTASSSTAVDTNKPVREALQKARDEVSSADRAVMDSINSLKGGGAYYLPSFATSTAN